MKESNMNVISVTTKLFIKVLYMNTFRQSMKESCMIAIIVTTKLQSKVI